jgi:secreted PhoX family phosphatase
MDHSKTSSRLAEEAENVGRNESGNISFDEILDLRLSRRSALRTALLAGAASLVDAAPSSAESPAPAVFSFDFTEIAAGSDETIHVADGHDADVLIRWGDPVAADAPAFDPFSQSAAAQARQFGYNNDFVGYVPLDGSRRGLLVVNHEYTNREIMFPGLGAQDAKSAFAAMTRERVDIEMMAHGGSIIEIARGDDGKWNVVRGSRYARRITGETEMEITGPAAGHTRLRTSSDPGARRVHGMLNNCAGGVTPWGTWLSCEENVNNYFSGRLADGSPEARFFKRYGLPGNAFNWGAHHPRFDLSQEPNEPNRFGWVVEIDPLDPTSTPKKRTALGRFKHEGAEGIVNADGRYVVYLGDDERFEYVYKFVTAGRIGADRAANLDLLDHGTLFVARFDADGTGTWLPLIHGEGELTAANGFASQADVLINARFAADLLGATKMDRPEDVEASAETGRVYVVLTNNTSRKPDQIDAANPRAPNRFGHILELTPSAGDHAAPHFHWEVLIKGGNPGLASSGAQFSAATTDNGWFGMPDNVAVDHRGRLWVATDGNSPAATGRGDGIWAVETRGPGRGTSRHFFRVPNGAEMCGPRFTPDDETFFVAVQHPGETTEGATAIASFEAPSTRWPDFRPDMPPRPSVVAITRRGGGKIA